MAGLWELLGAVMGCFCKGAFSSLAVALPSLNVAMPAMPNAQVALSLASWLSAGGLPADPWIPDPAWLHMALPRLSMRADALATVSAIANLRAQVMAQFGLDLTVAAQAGMFARVAATLSARVCATLGAGGWALEFGLGWMQLASLNFAIDQVGLALSAGVFANAAAYDYAPSWANFLAELLSLLPVIAIGLQMGLDLRTNFAADLAASMRALLAIRLPALDVGAMAGLSATLQAVASLSASLGVPALSLGLPGVQAMVAARLNLLLPQISAAFRISLALPDLLAALLSLLPKLAFCPTSSATPEVVQIAMSMNVQALAALTWQAPAVTSVALLRTGLPVISLSASLTAALGVSAALSPCGAGCDGNAVLKAALS